jgi:hypothetical protein
MHYLQLPHEQKDIIEADRTKYTEFTVCKQIDKVAAALHRPFPTFPLPCLETFGPECPVTRRHISNGSKSPLHRCENLQVLKFHATLKRVTHHSVSGGKKSHVYSGAARSESLPGYGLS